MRRDLAGVAGVTWARDVPVSSQEAGQGSCNSLECYGRPGSCKTAQKYVLNIIVKIYK